MSLTQSGRLHLGWVRAAASALSIGLLASACGGGGGSSSTTTPPPPPPQTYTIGGSISGLNGSGLVLQDNGGDNLTVASGSTSFTFATALASGSKYAVTVMTSPSGQKCAVSNGSGTVNGANVTNVAVSCTSATTTFTVGGTISGLSGNGLVLQDNGGNNLTVASGATKFTFSQALTNGAAYKVTVSASPPGQKCTVTNGSGTVAGANVTTVAVACTTTAYSVSGTVTGLTGSGLVLQDNGGNNLAVAAPTGSSANFTFTGTLLNGAAYAVTVLTQPTAPVQRCTVTNGSGKIAGASVTNVQVACARVGQYVFVANNADGAQGDITSFTINAQTGALTPVGGVGTPTLFPADVGPNGVIVDPSGQFVYVSNGGSDDVSREMLNSDGSLTLQGQFSTTSTVPVALAITPADTFLYASGHGTSNPGVILGFSVNPLSGALIGVVNPNAPFPFSNPQLGIAIDPTSSLVFSAGDPHFLYVNAIAADGTLTQTVGSGASDASLEGINGVAVWPKGGSSGGYVYTSNNLSNNVGVFSYDSTGNVTLVGSAPAGNGTAGIAIDATGKYLYVTNYTDGTLSAFSINAQTGALTAIGSAVATGNVTAVANPGPIDVKIDPSSQFLYCVNKIDGSVSLFTIGATGALTLVNSYVSAPDGHGAGSNALAVY